MSVDVLNEIVERPVSIVLLDFGAVAVDVDGREAVDLLLVAQLLVLAEGAVDFGNLDSAVADVLGGQLVPGRSHALAVAAPNQKRSRAVCHTFRSVKVAGDLTRERRT